MTPRLAAITYDRGFDVDGLLASLCRKWAVNGIHLGGLLQVSRGSTGACASGVRVVDLRTKATFDIWEERGSEACGCRLDERGLAVAASCLEQAIDDRVDLVIINRFGRAESLGRGLLPIFAAALSVGVPLLTAVRAPYDEAWGRFHGGLGQDLPPDIASATEWAERGKLKSSDQVQRNPMLAS